ncbi:50S ribosomal protein L4 [Candidatus Pacearchaeota archaeon]|nr:50S ribosomal protein L4 [Candidatus Pacearchaeota archaeon]
MKTAIYDITGKNKSEIEMPALFMTPIREDMVAKYFEAEKFAFMQPYGSYPEAGKRHSASGTISHRRHEWKGHYGKGISRAPRKVMWRRGTQFYWVGAETAQSRGGRAAHPPKPAFAYRKINKKEQVLAMHAALAATFSAACIAQRYTSLSKQNSSAVIESLPKKTKELSAALHAIFGEAAALVMKQKAVRAGKGKRRGRKYKSNAGLLVIKSTKETAVFKGIEVKSTKEIRIHDLYPLGRLTLYTKQALEELA